VIQDSVPWREELCKVAERLERRKTQRRWTERTGFLVERDVMTSAYAVRKLIEARKVSDELSAQRVVVKRHPLIGRAPDIWDRYEFWKHYDLEHGTNAELTLETFCNQIIHSWVWSLSATDPGNEFDGIFVSSDRNRRSCLYFISIQTLIKVFRAVGSEDIVYSQMQRDEHGEMQWIIRSSGRPPFMPDDVTSMITTRS
jgi:hypothetical protein